MISFESLKKQQNSINYFYSTRSYKQKNMTRRDNCSECGELVYDYDVECVNCGQSYHHNCEVGYDDLSTICLFIANYFVCDEKPLFTYNIIQSLYNCLDKCKLIESSYADYLEARTNIYSYLYENDLHTTIPNILNKQLVEIISHMRDELEYKCSNCHTNATTIVKLHTADYVVISWKYIYRIINSYRDKQLKLDADFGGNEQLVSMHCYDYDLDEYDQVILDETNYNQVLDIIGDDFDEHMRDGCMIIKAINDEKITWQNVIIVLRELAKCKSCQLLQLDNMDNIQYYESDSITIFVLEFD